MVLASREEQDVLVVVLDLKMPELDGIAVLQQVRSLNSHTPVIVLTGSGSWRRNSMQESGGGEE